MKSHIIFLAVALLPYLPARADAPKRVSVSAGKLDRQESIVSFPLPDSGHAIFRLRGDDGKTIDAISDGARAWFVLDALPSGATRTYTIEPAQPDPSRPPDVKLETTNGTYKFSARTGNDFTEILPYESEKTPLPKGIEPKYQRGGYISHVYTPSGRLLTDDYPPNHKHHHGIWSPWTKTEFEGRHPDFWNMGDQTGRVDPAGVTDHWSGPVCAGLRAKHKFIDMIARPEKVALTEQWELIVFRRMGGHQKPYYVFDLNITQNAVDDTPLILPKYHYGGLGFRGRREWDGPAVTFLNSEGKGREGGDQGQRGRWCWIGGKAEGDQTIGIAILDHPSNFRAPQPMRLNPSQPFFCYSPSQLGDWRIEPGKPYVARYRFIAADDTADPKEIDRLWNEYAEPVKVTVE
jgi:hypothetical protein